MIIVGLNKKSFGLTEVIVSAVILSAVIAGFFATFVGTRKYINKSNHRVIAANYIRSNLSYLYNQVREDTWDTGELSEGSDKSLHTSPPADWPSGSNYSVIDHGGYREVIINLKYPVGD